MDKNTMKFMDQVKRYAFLSEEKKKIDKEQKELKKIIEKRKDIWSEELAISETSKKLALKDGVVSYEVMLTDVITTEYDQSKIVPLFEERGLDSLLKKSADKKSVEIAINNGKISQEEADALLKIKSCYTKLAVKAK